MGDFEGEGVDEERTITIICSSGLPYALLRIRAIIIWSAEREVSNKGQAQGQQAGTPVTTRHVWFLALACAIWLATL